MKNGKIIIFSAPSGSGKSTLIGHLLKRFPQLEFSISATSRAPRGSEVNGKEYYFLTNEEFKNKVAAGEFVEWEEVYAGTCYGTLRSELKRIWDKGHVIVFDVDVKGGVNLKKIFGDDALSIFIMPPSVEELRRRLEKRGYRHSGNHRQKGRQSRRGDHVCPPVRQDRRKRFAGDRHCRCHPHYRIFHRIAACLKPLYSISARSTRFTADT